MYIFDCAWGESYGVTSIVHFRENWNTYSCACVNTNFGKFSEIANIANVYGMLNEWIYST